MISVIVPVFNEEENIVSLHRSICSVIEKMGEPFEILFIDDGSTDGTFEKMKSLRPLRAIRFRRNFGQTSAMDAGFSAAKGEVIVTLDGDLQNDPADIPGVVAKLREGYDVVSGWRQDRHDPIGRKILSWAANGLTRKMTGLFLHDHACALKAYRKDVFNDVHLYGEMHVFLPAYLFARGAKVAEIPVRHHARTHGISKHSIFKAFKDLSDLVTIHFLSQHMNRPLLFFGGTSFLMIGLGFLSAASATVLKIFHIRNFGQTPLPILAVFLVIIGFLLFMMGFLAELILRVYFEGQNKTPYIVKETLENK